jgi:hypothetical protein
MMTDYKNSSPEKIYYILPGDGCFVVWNNTVYRQNKDGGYTILDREVQQKTLFYLRRNCHPKTFEDIKIPMDLQNIDVENTMHPCVFIPPKFN